MSKDRAMALAKLKIRLMESINKAMGDEDIGDGSVGYVSDDLVEGMADAAINVWAQCAKHEDWLRRET